MNEQTETHHICPNCTRTHPESTMRPMQHVGQTFWYCRDTEACGQRRQRSDAADSFAASEAKVWDPEEVDSDDMSDVGEVVD